METKTVNMQLRKPTKPEVLNKEGNGLKFGIIYYVESTENPGTFCGMLVTGSHTNQREFSAWYSQGRIWVPVAAIENKITLLIENQ